MTSLGHGMSQCRSLSVYDVNGEILLMDASQGSQDGCITFMMRTERYVLEYSVDLLPWKEKGSLFYSISHVKILFKTLEEESRFFQLKVLVKCLTEGQMQRPGFTKGPAVLEEAGR